MKIRWWHVVIEAVVAAMVAVLIGGCNSGSDPASEPRPCPTWQAPDGTWMEEDNEEVDGDPCDLDDAWEVDLDRPKTPAVKKPAAKPSAAAPIGGRKKRF